MKLSFLFILLFLLLSKLAYARVEPNETTLQRYSSFNLPNTEVMSIHSQQVNQDYKIYINIPASYYQYPNSTYPALFLLDADYSFPITSGIVTHLSDRGRIPEMFIIGIAYDGPEQYKLHRTRDYTPVFTPTGGYGAKYQKHSGGAGKFSLFLKEELIPSLNQRFRLNSQKTLVGHSYGGLFGSWLMLQEPKLFNNYIIVSPSLWYDNNYLFSVEQNFSQKNPSLPVRAYFAIGSKENTGDYPMIIELENYIAQLHNHHYKGLQLYYQNLAPEDHDTVFPVALTQGLMALYRQD